MFNLQYRLATNQGFRRLRLAYFQGRMRRYIQTAVVLIASSAILVFCFNYRLPVPPVAEHASSAHPSTFDILAKARLAELQARYSAEEVLDTTGLKTGNFSWDEYVKEIRGVYQEYFLPPPSIILQYNGRPDTQGPMNTLGKPATISRVGAKLDESFDLLSYGRNASAREVFHMKVPDSIPHIIYTTSKDTFFPQQFDTWQHLNSKAGWHVRSYNDDAIWEWMEEVFGMGNKKTQGRSKKVEIEGDDQEATGDKAEEAPSGQGSSPLVLDVYQQIDNGVLRADVFRYLALLMEGGVYTDTDTACIRPIIRWPGIRENHWDLKDITDPLLMSLPHMADLLAQTENNTVKYEVQPGEKEPVQVKVTPAEAIRNRLTELKLDAWDPPKLVIGVEWDNWGPSATAHWTEKAYARGMQIVQSTIMAQPGHPVFVDVLGRIFKDLHNGRGAYADEIVDELGRRKHLSRERLMDIVSLPDAWAGSALDFTGPGVL
ncbi:hypothetical protein QFC22_005562 [Naganishia vaughanmartiniae]|uniref:Uncharacterized protein n=1 Tax=Naganishia vaughanmartiniae TaxID=1424756 RepID=A0ACC2WV39_9TREE|nr:hypothetical protein QFC22_005562 [Naganishia vaughanmartiniae]